MCALSVTHHDIDLLDHPFRLRANQIDRQQTVLEIGTCNLHPLREKKHTLELPCRDPPMEIMAILILLLTSADDELALLDRDLELGTEKASHRERDSQLFGLIAAFGDPLDVVRRVAVRCGAGDPFYSALDLVEACLLY